LKTFQAREARTAIQIEVGDHGQVKNVQAREAAAALQVKLSKQMAL
jgi:hypothetical protein